MDFDDAKNNDLPADLLNFRSYFLIVRVIITLSVVAKLWVAAQVGSPVIIKKIYKSHLIHPPKKICKFDI